MSAYRSKKYLESVAWIALNDGDAIDPSTGEPSITITMTSHVFRVPTKQVIADVRVANAEFARVLKTDRDRRRADA